MFKRCPTSNHISEARPECVSVCVCQAKLNRRLSAAELDRVNDFVCVYVCIYPGEAVFAVSKLYYTVCVRAHKGSKAHLYFF